MGAFLVFIIKSTCCLAVFYLFYRLLLSRDTFHRFNRMALLGVIVFSIAIPFVQLAADEPVAVQRTALELERFLQMGGTPVEEESRFPSWLAALFMIYAGGCLFFAGRFLYSVCQIVRLIRSGERAVLEDGTRLVVTDLTVPPFSWMKYIVISRIDMEESGAEILAHEQAHIRACHSLDMWFAGCCAVLHWFNPAVWLLKQELQNVHEYEADESVIAHGVDAKHYQLLLIKKAVGAQRFTSMANSFDHSKHRTPGLAGRSFMCFLLQPLPLLRSPALKSPAGWKISPKWSLPKSSHPDRTKRCRKQKKTSLSCVLWNLNRICVLPKVPGMPSRTRLS